jgi:hypothetical protein
MQLIFRKFPAGDLPPPGPGEIYIRPDPARVPAGRGVACVVLEHGTGVLVQGSAPAECLVIDASSLHPTFDDMLAATFAQQLLEGRQLPAGCRAFADYAAVVRSGLRPCNLPPEDSIEGIFLAIRNAAGKDVDLTELVAAERFRKDWARMATCLLTAAEQGLNPVTASPFADRPEFMHERAYLVRDREVYRQDVLRGERWLVRLPGGPELSSGLFLRRPTSLFFPYWSRTDRDAPAGGAYLLLAVDWGQGVWMISTDPAQRLPIAPLAAALQTAEAAKDAAGAAADPWYDGNKPEHAGTLVAAPHRGTKLSEREVLQVVKKWAQVRMLRRSRPFRELIWAAVGLVTLTLLVLIYLKPHPAPPSSSRTVLVVTQDGKPVPQSSFQEVFDDQSGSCVGGKVEKRDLEPNASVQLTFEVQPPTREPYDIDRTVRVQLLLRTMSDPPLALSDIKLKFNGGPEQTVAFRFNRNSRDQEIDTEVVTEPVDGAFLGQKSNAFTVSIRSGSASRQRVEIRGEWLPVPTLHVLAVGVSTYPKALGTTPDLPNACEDARALANAFRQQKGTLFHDVEVQELLNENATKKDIVEAIRKLQEEKATVYDVVIVALSGHGKVNKHGQWFFTPSNYDPHDEDSTGLFWIRGLDSYIANFNSDVVLIVDTCHSGALTKNVSLENRFKSGARKGLVVLAASLSTQLAQEDSDWGHGALTLAVLEAMGGEYLYPKPGKPRPTDPPPLPRKDKGPLNLDDLGVYARRRVAQLTGNAQSVIVMPRADFDPQKIAIALPRGARR